MVHYECELFINDSSMVAFKDLPMVLNHQIELVIRRTLDFSLCPLFRLELTVIHAFMNPQCMSFPESFSKQMCRAMQTFVIILCS